MDILIYAKEDEDTLREIATADPDEADGNVAMLIDLLLDQADDDFEARSFRVFTAEGVVDVEVNGDDYVNPRRDMTVTPLDEEEEAEEEEEDEEEEEPKPKRKPGRPKGSGKKRGRPKGSTTKKRGPGRPPGSKNKKSTSAKGSTKKKRGPGRPPGSKNKKKSQKVKRGSFKRTDSDDE